MNTRCNYTPKTIFKATRILPLWFEGTEGKKQRMIQIEYKGVEKVQKELIPYEKVWIIPVPKNNPKSSYVEKGYFSMIIFDDNNHEISREERPGIKLYLDDEIFQLIPFTFGRKIS